MCTKHSIHDVVYYARLSPAGRRFALSLSANAVPVNYQEALAFPHWKEAIDEEMKALTERDTWNLVPTPLGVDVVGCRWVFAIKFHPDDTVDLYKAWLVAKGFTQTYGLDFFDTFSAVTCINTICVLFSIAVVYMEQPPGYVAHGESQIYKLRKTIYGLKQSPRVWFDKFNKVVSLIGFARSSADRSLFIRKTTKELVILVVYVNDIFLTSDDQERIDLANRRLQQYFVTKDMSSPKYFLGIEILRKHNSVVLSQRKYALDLLKETGLFGARLVHCPMTVGDVKSWTEDSALLLDSTLYKRLLRKLIYLMVTRPNICYAVGKVRNGHTMITQQDIVDVLDKQLLEGMGVLLTEEEQQKCEASVSLETKQLLAVHEAGHILLAHLFPRFDWHAFSQLLPGGKETAISVFYPREEMVDQGYTTFGYLKMQMVVAHGGRCAEKLVFGDDITDGGRDDLEKITKPNFAVLNSYSQPTRGKIADPQAGRAAQAVRELGAVSSRPWELSRRDPGSCLAETLGAFSSRPGELSRRDPGSCLAETRGAASPRPGELPRRDPGSCLAETRGAASLRPGELSRRDPGSCLAETLGAVSPRSWEQSRRDPGSCLAESLGAVSPRPWELSRRDPWSCLADILGAVSPRPWELSRRDPGSYLAEIPGAVSSRSRELSRRDPGSCLAEIPGAVSPRPRELSRRDPGSFLAETPGAISPRPLGPRSCRDPWDLGLAETLGAVSPRPWELSRRDPGSCLAETLAAVSPRPWELSSRDPGSCLPETLPAVSPRSWEMSSRDPGSCLAETLGAVSPRA
ncbi:hypothetical protein KSP39_PZI009480 [Platanthera zijinensis]|uniref:Uncharacterized protein n=1 Tax=Platanthera zijinensis TaxID=2320716 RepID=A0AAP0BL38_9ASPA